MWSLSQAALGPFLSQTTHSESSGRGHTDGNGRLLHPPCGPAETVNGSCSHAPEEAEPLNHSSGSPAPGACCDSFIKHVYPFLPSSPRSKCQLPQRKSFVAGLLQFKHHYEKQTSLITRATPGRNKLSSWKTTFWAWCWTVRTAPLLHHHLFSLCVTALILFTLLATWSLRLGLALFFLEERRDDLEGFFSSLSAQSIPPRRRWIRRRSMRRYSYMGSALSFFSFFFNSTFWCSSSGKGPCFCLQTEPAHYFTGSINKKPARWAVCLPDSVTKPELAEET